MTKTYTNAWRAAFETQQSAEAACYFFAQRKVYRAFPCDGYWYFRTGLTTADIMVTAMPTDLAVVADEEFDALYERHLEIMKEALTPIP